VRETVTVKAGVLPARPQTISADHARKLANDFTAPVRPVSPAPTVVADEVSRATALIGTLTATSGGDVIAPTTDTSVLTGALGTSTLAPVTTLATVSTSPILSTPILATPANPTVSPTPTTSPTPIINLTPVLQPVTNLLKK